MKFSSMDRTFAWRNTVGRSVRSSPPVLQTKKPDLAQCGSPLLQLKLMEAERTRQHHQPVPSG